MRIPFPHRPRRNPSRSPRPAALLGAAALLAPLAPAQELRVFELNPATTQLVHWTATSNLGPMGAFLQSYSFSGDIVVDFDQDPSVGTARITGARMRVPNSVVAAVQGGGPATVFWKDLVLKITSPDFTIIPAFPWGIFSTTVDLEVVSGVVLIEPPFGPALQFPLAGTSLGSIPVSGAFPTVGPAQAMTLDPFQFSMDFAAPGFTGTFTHDVTQLDGTGACPEPVPHCVPFTPGTGAQLSFAGSTSVAADDFGFSISRGPANAIGLVFYGTRADEVLFGNGRLCVGGPLTRLQLVQLDQVGSAAVRIPLGPHQSSAVPLSPGSHRNFQFWHRDLTPGGAGFDLSNGMAVTFCP